MTLVTVYVLPCKFTYGLQGFIISNKTLTRIFKDLVVASEDELLNVEQAVL